MSLFQLSWKKIQKLVMVLVFDLSPKTVPTDPAIVQMLNFYLEYFTLS